MYFVIKKISLIAILAIGVLAWYYEKVIAPTSGVPIQLRPEELHWIKNPSLHGLQTAVLAGDYKNAEPYAERVKIPAHFRLKPHSHPNAARMEVVLVGTLYYAYGDTFDETKLKTLPPGSFFTEPPNMPHYAMTKDEEVVLQINAIGPAATNYIELQRNTQNKDIDE